KRTWPRSAPSAQGSRRSPHRSACLARSRRPECSSSAAAGRRSGWWIHWMARASSSSAMVSSRSTSPWCIGARPCSASCMRPSRASLTPRRAAAAPFAAAPTPLRVLASRSHGDAVLDRMLERLGTTQRISVGSALKFGLLAEGAADLYVRRGSTCEWDTAAGHAVVLEAGGAVVDFTGHALRYNERDTLINPSFIAYADASQNWVGRLLAPDGPGGPADPGGSAGPVGTTGAGGAGGPAPSRS